MIYSLAKSVFYTDEIFIKMINDIDLINLFSYIFGWISVALQK